MIYIRAHTAKQMQDLIAYMYDTHKMTFGGADTQAICDLYVRAVTARPRRLKLIMAYDAEYNDCYSIYSTHMFKQLGGGNAALELIPLKAFIHQMEPPEPFVKALSPTLHLGFEIEGCVADDTRDDLVAYLSTLYPGVDQNNLVHYDGSVRPKCRSIEIVTPPLACDLALERLEWLVGMLSILTDEGLFSTNATCGMHVNVSDAHSFPKASRQIRDAFAHAFMKRLDVQKWKKTYRRSGNRYCWWEGNPRTIKDMLSERAAQKMAKKLNVGIGRARHWQAINTQHLHVNASARRIEVRVAGGKDYHAKHDRLRDFLLDILTAAEHAHDSI